MSEETRGRCESRLEKAGEKSLIKEDLKGRRERCGESLEDVRGSLETLGTPISDLRNPPGRPGWQREAVAPLVQ